MHIKDIPGGHSVSQLTHATDPKIQSKFRFFADCLNLITRKAGQYYYFEADTHISLLSSLQYSAEAGHRNYQGYIAKNLVKQLKYIIRTHPLLNNKDRMVALFYSKTIPKLSVILAQSGHTKSDVISIDSNLKEILKDFSIDYIDNLVKCVANYIGCGHLLAWHKKDLDYLARLIFSYFYLSDYSRKDISYFVSKLLEGSIKRYDDKMYIEGTIPLDLHRRLIEHNRSNTSFNDELFNEIERYFKNRTTIQQVQGFVDLAKYDKYDHTLIFKIDGVWIKEEEVVINGVRLINTEHFRQQHEESMKLDTVSNFLDRRSILVEHTVKAYSQTVAEQEAFNNVKAKVDRMGFILDKHLVLSPLGYIVKTDDGQLWVNNLHEITPLYPSDLQALQNRDAAIKNEEFKQFLLSKETILVEAHGEINLSKSLHDYSKFVEQLTKNNLDGITPLEGIPERILAIAYLLLLAESPALKLMTRNIGYSAIVNSVPYPVVGKENKGELHDFLSRKLLPSISEMNRRFKHPHTRYRFKIANNSPKKDFEMEAFHYYLRHILMLVRYRNIQEHMSSSEKQYAKKLKLSINSLLFRILNLIAKEMNKPESAGLSPEKVIHALILKGKTKADTLNINFHV